MNPLDIVLIIALAGMWFVYRHTSRVMKARLAREQAVRDAELQKDHDALVAKIQARTAALQPPSEN